MIDNIVDI